MIVAVVFLTISLFIGNNEAQNSPAAVIVHPPTYSTASEGQTVRMTCAAYGVPVPTISWSRATEDVAAKLADSSSGYKKYDKMVTVNGTDFKVSVLEICGVALSETDEFICSADNGVSGIGIASDEARFFLSVTGSASEPPSVVVRPPSDTTVDYGSTVEAVCIAYGNPVPTITWNKDGCSDISCITNAKMFSEVVTYGDVSFRKSTLQLCNVDESNTGSYSCSASNGIGGVGVAPGSYSWQLTVNPKPVPTTTSTEAPTIATTSCPDVRVDTGTTSTISGRSRSSSMLDSSSSPTEGASGRFRNVADERTYQAVVGIETVAIAILLVIATVAIIAAISLSRNKPKQLAEIAVPPKDPRVQSVENPIHGEEYEDDQVAADADTMTYADLAKKMEAES